MHAVRKPVWKTSSFLVYAGGLTVLGAAIAAIAYLSGHYGKGALTAWALLILVVLSAIAESLKRRRRWAAAGIFAFASVVITLISATVGWFFVTDFVSNGGGWSYVVTLLVGLAYLMAGSVSRKPSAFWLHLVGGVLIGATLLHWWHASDTDWALISAVSLVYVAIAYMTKRSSWAVLATIGFLGATVHYLVSTAGSTSIGGAGFNVSVPSISGWSPSVAFACLGFWLVLLGLAGRRRRTE
jgi:hypothetical protein